MQNLSFFFVLNKKYFAPLVSPVYNLLSVCNLKFPKYFKETTIRRMVLWNIQYICFLFRFLFFKHVKAGLNSNELFFRPFSYILWYKTLEELNMHTTCMWRKSAMLQYGKTLRNCLLIIDLRVQRINVSKPFSNI